MNRDDGFSFDQGSFDEWAQLARIDPDGFEQRRRQVIAEFLQRSGPQRALGEALQREIDSVRRRAASPQDALLELSAMLRAQLTFLGEELGALRQGLCVIEGERARFAGAGPQGGDF